MIMMMFSPRGRCNIACWLGQNVGRSDGMNTKQEHTGLFSVALLLLFSSLSLNNVTSNLQVEVRHLYFRIGMAVFACTHESGMHLRGAFLQVGGWPCS